LHLPNFSYLRLPVCIQAQTVSSGDVTTICSYQKAYASKIQNKITAQVKDAILEAFTIVGGEDYLVKVAKNDPRTFCTLLGKVLPTQVEAAAQGPITYQIITGVSEPDEEPSWRTERNSHASGDANGRAEGN